MFANGMILLDWMGIVVFAITGALVASRNQMDALGFVLLGTVTGIGGGTIRDLLLGIHPILWVERPAYLVVCILVSLAVFFTAHLIQSRLRLILWLDGIGLALFAAVGAERALSVGTTPIVAATMGVISACFGGILRDILGQERSVIFGHELYITAAIVTASLFVALDVSGAPRELSVVLATAAGFILRAGALSRGWSLPRYRPRPPRER
jgi:uncharacterized membrane protein YeiH